MSERHMTWIVLAILLTLAALSGCATVEPPKKAAIPDDLKVICYQGNVAVYSESAEQAAISTVPCDGKQIGAAKKDGSHQRPQEVQVVREGVVEYRGERFDV